MKMYVFVCLTVMYLSQSLFVWYLCGYVYIYIYIYIHENVCVCVYESDIYDSLVDIYAFGMYV